MKKILSLIMFVLIFCQWCSANNTEVVSVASRKITIYDIAARRIMDVWDGLVRGGSSSEGFIGRCFGVARKLKMIMPLIIFKLGVIVTILTFLTIFSLKSLGLLVTLLMMNIGGIASKLTLLKQGSGSPTPPQNVHFHIHPGKDGQFHTAPSGPWDRSEDATMDSTESYNLYNKLLNSPYLSSNLMYNNR